MKCIAATQALYKDKRQRAWELDFMRGIAVIAMCFDHLMFDLAYCKYWFSERVANAAFDKLISFAQSYWGSTATFGFRFWAHHIFVFVFLFLVGVSCAFSRDNVRRGALLSVVCFAFTGVTMIFAHYGLFGMEGIVFGILHCIALCILCAAAVDNLTKKVGWLNKYLPLVLGVIILFTGIYFKFWNISYDKYFTHSHFLGYILGSKQFGDDWFGLWPQLGAVLIGMYWGKAAYPTKTSLVPALGGKWNSPVNFIGRHALIAYLIHQVAIAGAVAVVCPGIGYRF